jgi:hypothetical protein
MSITVIDETTNTERPMLVADEATSVLEDDAHGGGEDVPRAVNAPSEAPRRRVQVSSFEERPRYADSGPSTADHRMRLPSFDQSCPHVRDQIIPMNGGHFNVDQYLRVLRAKAEVDPSIAMALTAAGQPRMVTPTRVPVALYEVR